LAASVDTIEAAERNAVENHLAAAAESYSPASNATFFGDVLGAVRDKAVGLQMSLSRDSTSTNRYSWKRPNKCRAGYMSSN
jgi:hypothetical protein